MGGVSGKGFWGGGGGLAGGTENCGGHGGVFVRGYGGRSGGNLGGRGLGVSKGDSEGSTGGSGGSLGGALGV